MDSTQAPARRVRINVKTGAKGQHTYDCTIEIADASIEEVLAESDKLVAELDARYSPADEQ